eukprot:7379142-Prymnesium_polylepis.3
MRGRSGSSEAAPSGPRRRPAQAAYARRPPGPGPSRRSAAACPAPSRGRAGPRRCEPRPPPRGA